MPSNYFYNHHSDVEKNDIKLKNQPIDWNTSYGKVLEEALVLSEDEQVFGMVKPHFVELKLKYILCVYLFKTRLVKSYSYSLKKFF